MTSNVTRTNNGKRLVAAIAVLALIACAFVAFVPTADAADPSASNVVNADTDVTVPAEGGNYYVSAENTADAAIAINAGSVTGTNVVNIFMKNGADITLSTGNAGVVNIYIATGEWTRTTPADQTTNVVGTVTYNDSTKATANSNLTSKTVAATAYGFEAASTDSVFAANTYVEYTPSESGNTQYLNPKVVGNGVNTFNLTDGSISIPAEVEIPGNFTVNGGSSGDAGFNAVNTLSFQTGTVAATTTVPEHSAFVTDTTAIAINNSTGELTVSTASWTTGTVTVSKGSVTTSAALTFNDGTLKAIASNWVDENPATLYSSFADFSGSIMLVYGDYSNTDVTLQTGDSISVAEKSAYSGTVTSGSNSARVDVSAIDGRTFYAIQSFADYLGVGASISETGTEVSGSNVTIYRASGAVTVSGAMLGNNMSVSSTITIGTLTNINNTAASLIIPSTSSVSFAQGGSIVMSDGSALYLYGSLSTGSGVDTQNCIVKTGTSAAANIYGSDSRIASAFCAGLVVDGTATGSQIKFNSVAEEAIDVGTYGALVSALNTSRPIKITQTIEIPANASVSIVGKNVTFNGAFTDGVGILVKEGATLSITDSTFDQADNVDVSITTEQYTQLNITNSLIFMIVDANELCDLNLDNHEVTYDYSTDDVKVGFGTTLVLSSIPKGDIYVYGTLTINEGTTVTVEYGKTMTVKPDATVNMNGTLNVQGTVEFEAGSVGNIAGTVNIRNPTTGGAQFISYGDVEMSGTMNVNAKGSTAPLQNELIAWSAPGEDLLAQIDDTTDISAILTAVAAGNITDAWTGFTVTGTLNVEGSMSGIILDQGEITVNGTSDEAIVILFDGVTLNINSVTGNLYIGDYEISNEAVYDVNGNPRDNTSQSNGNIIVLEDVRGVSVREAITSGNYTIDGESYAYYISDMYISGTASKTSGSTVNENITILGICNEIQIDADENMRAGAVRIAEGDTLTLGEKVFLGNYTLSLIPNDQKFIVEGTLNITGDEAGYMGTDRTFGILTMPVGTIEITGTVVIGPEASSAPTSGNTTYTVDSEYVLPGNVTGVRYALQTTQNNVTSTTIYYSNFDDAVAQIANAVENTVTVYGDVEVGTTVTVADGSSIDLDAGAVLTINEGVTLTFANGGKISGTQASVEVLGTMESANYREDVSVGSIGADVIVTNEPARTWTSFYNALENATAPETIELARDIALTQNTTIPEGVTVTTEYNLNTSRYTLTVDGTLDVLQGGNINIAGEPDDGNVIANGVVVMRSLGESEANQTTLAQFDGAHFTLRTGATVSNYVTNLAYAAENVDNGTITVTGAVSAGDVVFNEAANGVLVINVVTNPGQEVNTVLSVSSMDLNGAKFTVDASSRVTGSITLPYGDGTADAQIDLSRASGEFSIESSSLATATGTEYTAYIYGQTSNGSFTVAAGTVDVYHDGSVLGFTANSTFEVASGATLVVKDATLTVANDDRTGNAYVTIAGTMELDNGVLARVQTGDSIVIEGTLDVIENANSNIVMYVPGVVNVDEDATFTVNTKMVVGSAPESLGIGGTLSGKYVINANGYILAYTGADLTNAQINWNAATGESDAETTVFYINDVEYATAYASIGNEHGINSIFGTAAGEDIELSGLNTTVPVGGYKWEDANGETSTVSDIGTPEQVYIEFDPAEVPGVVTVGAGIDLFIDGVQVSGYGPGSGTSVGPNLDLSVGTHRVSYEIRAGWDGSSVVFTFNGQTIQNGDTITITADMTSFTLSATGAINSTGTSDNGSTTGGDDGLGLTDYLLIVLVVLIVVMAIIVAIRLMRS